MVDREGNSYDLYEFSSSQFTNLHTHALEPGALFGYNDLRSSGVLDFDMQAADPTATYRIVNINGEIQHTLPARKSQLMSEKAKSSDGTNRPPLGGDPELGRGPLSK
jgi:hypothetical protein